MSKEKFLWQDVFKLDEKFLVAQLGYHLEKSSSPSSFLVA